MGLLRGAPPCCFFRVGDFGWIAEAVPFILLLLLGLLCVGVVNGMRVHLAPP